MALTDFLNDAYQRHNRRRQEHLATLGLPLAHKSVLEFGAGVGDHTSFFLDRACTVTVTDARAENVEFIQARFPSIRTHVVDIEQDVDVPIGVHDIVYAYGLLYHLANPSAALARMAKLTGEILLLETCVSFGSESAVNSISEDVQNPTQAAHGLGCRPTRRWVFEELHRNFPHVYVTRTQPWHSEFPIDWTATPPVNETGLYRGVFVASHTRLDNPCLSDVLLEKQARG
jgi:hypothetical protein